MKNKFINNGFRAGQNSELVNNEFDVQKEIEEFLILESLENVESEIGEGFHVIDQQELEREYTNYMETQHTFKISELPLEAQQKIEKIAEKWPKFGKLNFD